MDKSWNRKNERNERALEAKRKTRKEDGQP